VDSATQEVVDEFDNPLREGPDPSSRLIGRAQGVAVHASLDELTTIDFVFCDYGQYSGSSLGRYTVSGTTSERSIVGGTGKLRFARGYMTSRLLSSAGASMHRRCVRHVLHPGQHAAHILNLKFKSE
jgi:hypothetical protein